MIIVGVVIDKKGDEVFCFTALLYYDSLSFFSHQFTL